MQAETSDVTGMTCGGCTTNVSRALRAIDGVGDASMSYSAGEATVQYDERLTVPDQLKSAVRDAGCGLDSTNAAPGRAKGAAVNRARRKDPRVTTHFPELADRLGRATATD